MALGDETLPPVGGGPANQPVMTQAQLLEFTNMNGVNASLDALVEGGMRPEDAASMLENAGYDLGELAAPENVAAGATAPAPQVRRAEPNIKPTGSMMDIGFIAQLNSAGSQEEFNQMYDALPKVQQHVYDRSFAQDIDPAWASQQAQEFYNEQARINDPKYQEQLRVERERANALSSQSRNSAQQAAETSDRLLKIMDRLRGGPREGDGAVDAGKEAYRGRVGPFDSSVPNALSFSGGKREGWFADFKTLQDTLGLAEARLNKGQGNMTELERSMLRDAATGGLDYKRDDESFSVIFEDMYSMLQRQAERNKAALAAKEGAQQSPAPAAATPAVSPTPTAAPAATAPGLQLNRKYKDARGVERIFKGYDNQGNPIFSPVQ
jgi:hypothetical protein